MRWPSRGVGLAEAEGRQDSGLGVLETLFDESLMAANKLPGEVWMVEHYSGGRET